jgi:hypothetical protein
MKTGEMNIYKTYGTYQLVNDDGDRYYDCRHIQSGQTCYAYTLKEVKEVMEDLDKTYQEIQAAIRKLGVYGYKVYKEIA